MPNNITDAEIKKALEEILEIMLTMGDLQKSSTVSKSINLINKLEAENKRLKNAYKQCAWERDTFQEELKIASAENERLSRITRNLVGEIKAEAYTEFAERLDKASFITGYTVGYGGKDIPIKHITMANVRSILREMVGDNNETIL